VVGSGTLITFPVLLALGYPPVAANMSNNVGLVFGGVSGALGMRRELDGQRARMLRLGAASIAGATVGATLLIVLPASAFKAIVPVFIAVALALIIFQPRISGWLAQRSYTANPHGGLAVTAGVLLAGVYGGYFGAAQGILLLAIFTVALGETLPRSNALKNVMALLNNATAAIAFIAFGTVIWKVVALIALGSIAGGQIGARVARRLPDRVLRGVIVVVGVFAMAKLLLD
jgi:uncharacterized membrane protein YfcA